MIYTVTLNPALDKTVEIPFFTLDRVNRITSMRTDPGGKGINVSKVIQKLGGTSIAGGILAGHTGESIRTAVEEMGIETFFTFVNGETRTNLKIRDPIKHMNTDINEPGITVTEKTLNSLLDQLFQKTHPGDIVVLSGSLPNGAPKNTYGTWIRTLKTGGVKVFLDADGEPLRNGIVESPFLIKPNSFELAELMGRDLPSVNDLKDAAEELKRQYDIPCIVVSMGSEGALYITAEESLYAKGLKVPVGSTVGAGDSVVAAMAYAWEQELCLEESGRLSAATGAANVMSSGSQAAEYEQIESLLHEVEISVL